MLQQSNEARHGLTGIGLIDECLAVLGSIAADPNCLAAVRRSIPNTAWQDGQLASYYDLQNELYEKRRRHGLSEHDFSTQNGLLRTEIERLQQQKLHLFEASPVARAGATALEALTELHRTIVGTHLASKPND